MYKTEKMAFVAGNAFMGGKVAQRPTAVCNRWNMTLTRIDTSITVKEGNKVREIPADTELDLRRNLIESGVDVYTLGGKFRNCGGNGACGTCKVRLLNNFDNANPRTPREENLLNKQGCDSDIRLSCRTKISGPVSIETKPR
eukprot:Plantae.Rhodophyta-Purpureofilum_apyrenoidigerum.ctg22117.p3 GENE.Plantae.Rhodophyta-Purpureofilum_apyrenoidigerum.ctg22117~~Plantae.Rhodophyta-Purpureofilum_apyrenoidigerum.ctg22117.p3  ORF type:complete len:142 (+),score=19.00 Plantae.Rhodophyta-Purpureofilum_apyrenoidigerum.ctg22117:127-552(+)